MDSLLSGTRPIYLRGAFSIATTLLFAFVACSGGSGTSPQVPMVKSGIATSHAVHVFVKAPDGTTQRLDLAPGTELGTPGSQDPKHFDLHPLATDGAIAEFPPAATVGNAVQTDVTGTAWALVNRARMYCATSASDGLIPMGNIWDVPWSTAGSVELERSWLWFVYDTGGDGLVETSCASRLRYEENLLCIADQLGAIADAVNTTVWPALPGGTGTYTFGVGDASALDFNSTNTLAQDLTYAEWDIPPQADADRFIVRDLAIHVLGMLPTLDALPANLSQVNLTCPGGGQCSCTSLWGDLAEAPSGQTTPVSPAAISVDPTTATGGAWSLALFGVPTGTACGNPRGCVPTYPPSSVGVYDTSTDTNYGPTLATSALQLQGQILRSGARLLHDLIRRDVYSDLAAADTQRAQTASLADGNQAAWGLSAQGPYGTYTHAARVLTGRWEIGNGVDANGSVIPDPSAFNGHGDPAPENVVAINLLPQAFGGDLTPRLQDTSPQTPGEATAAQMVGRAGIVVPACVLDGQTPPVQALQDALAEQLSQMDGYPLNLYKQIVGRLSAPELVFGFGYALRTYELITDGADLSVSGGNCTSAVPLGCSGTGTCVPLSAASNSAVASALQVGASPLYAVVVAGGINRARLQTDPIARAGGLLEASQQFIDSGTWSEWGTALSLPSATSSALPAIVFQDAFLLGQDFERRLSLLQQATVPVAPSVAGDPHSVALGGLAELRSWAGVGIAKTNGSIGVNGGSTGNLYVQLSGMDYSTLGVDPSTGPGGLVGAIGFVYGPPWVAECAAHISKACPAGFDTQFVQKPSSASDVTSSTGYGATYGVVGPVFQLVVPYVNPTAPYFNPGSQASPPQFTSATGSHIYMVLLNDPASPLGEGQVLGVIRPDIVAGSAAPGLRATAFAVAPMQRELLHDALDLGQWVGATPSAIGEDTASEPAGYCVDGVPRDVFVPLDNELESGGMGYEDSWQHYLDLAMQAAQTADTLGQQLMTEDIQISQNQQTAGEQLATICGDFGALSGATVQSNGSISPSPTDATTRACMDTSTYDVAFLGPLPPNIQNAVNGGDANAISTAVRSAIGCTPPSGASTPVTATGLCAKTTPLTVAGLGATPAGAATGTPTSSTNPFPSTACQNLMANGALPASLKTSFQGDQFQSVLEDPSLNSNSALTVASQLTMSVDLSSNWTVSYGGTTIMASGAGPSYWPACLESSSCASIPLAAAVPAWNATFRSCASGALGSCNSLSPEGESNQIRLRVARAMWTLAMSGGVLPEAMFTQPMPAFFSDFCAGNDCVAYYPTGAFSYYRGNPVPANNTLFCKYGSSCYQLTTSNDGNVQNNDIGAVADLYTIGSHFYDGVTNGDVPNWYQQSYNLAYPDATPNPQSNGVYHTMASNSAAVFDPCITAFFAGTSGNGPQSCQGDTNGYPSAPTTPNPTALLSFFSDSTHIGGFGCQTPYGEPNTGMAPQSLASGYPWWTMLSVSDASFTTGAPCEQPSQWGPNGQLSGKGSGTNGATWNSQSDYWFGPGYFIPVQWTSFSNGYQGLADALNQQGWDLSRTTGDTAGAFNYDLKLNSRQNYNPAWPFGYSGETIAGHCWSKSDRATIFAGANAVPNGTCGAMNFILGAAVLACTPPTYTLNQGNLNAAHVPPVSRTSDIPNLVAWLALEQQSIKNIAAGLYVQTIPTAAVQDFQNNTVGSGSISGTRGQALLGLEQSVQNLPSAWTSIATDLQSVQNAIQAVYLAMQQAQLTEQTTDGSLSLQDLSIQEGMEQAVADFAETTAQQVSTQLDLTKTSVGSWLGAGAVVAAAGVKLGIQESFGTMEEQQISQMKQTASAVKDNQTSQALLTLATTTDTAWGDIQKQMDALRGDIAQVDQGAQGVVLASQQAAYQLAAGTGQDFATMPNGQQVPIPVNTVLRRQASGTEQRYQTALTNAKALAYMARRAIEQRIGVPFSNLTQNVGPLDPPAAWGDTICSLQGINYAELSTAVAPDAAGGGIDGSVDINAIDDFADAWVGDYVAKLQSFVAYYNTQYPSHQGDDTAVLSLRYDILPTITQCTVQSPNLLLNSGDLTQLSGPGWQMSSCDPTLGKCLSVVGGYALAPPQDGPDGAQATSVPPQYGLDGSVLTEGTSGPVLVGSGASWLVDQPSSASAVDAGGAGDGGASEGGSGATSTSSAPSNMIVQQVPLSAGTYVLSWWDQARDGNGNLVWTGSSGYVYESQNSGGGAGWSPEPSAPVPYMVEVLDPTGASVQSYVAAPYSPPQSGSQTPEGGISQSYWSARNTLTFTVAMAGPYTVAFAASAHDGGKGSVAVANVQLEASSTGQPSAYEETNGSHFVTGLDCPLSDSDFRSAFVHNCDPNGNCHYDLAAPMIIDTSALTGNTGLGAKLAPGNYNYRHIDLAVNLVGTNVHNCAGDANPNCYGSSYIQYTLQHDATAASIVGYDGNPRAFDFGVGSINYGKALAIEQYLTVPLSSSDQGLITQPGIQHVELGGRPLDGNYSLRIWDSPDLNWNALQDVQLILDYEYWSQVETTQGDARRLRGAGRHPIPLTKRH